MTWTVVLEDENRVPISSLSDDIHINIENHSHKYKLLHYLDPYGDTVFNRLQIDDLVNDLKIASDSKNNILFDELYEMAKRCKKEEHTYLFFYGN